MGRSFEDGLLGTRPTLARTQNSLRMLPIKTRALGQPSPWETLVTPSLYQNRM